MTYYGRSLSAFVVEDLPIFEIEQDIVSPIIHALDKMGEQLKENDVVVIASKIISKAEGRIIDLREIEPSEQAIRLSKRIIKSDRLIELILRQGKLLGWTQKHLLIETEFGFITANAGVDGSGGGSPSVDHAYLLPKNPDKSAASIRERFQNHYKTNIGVLIQDSSGKSWRRGNVGLSIGSSGIKVIDNIYEDPIRKIDLCGIPSTSASVNVGDQIAAIGNLLMGETNNATPVVIIRGLNVVDEFQTSQLLNKTKFGTHENDELQRSDVFVEVSPGIYHRKI